MLGACKPEESNRREQEADDGGGLKKEGAYIVVSSFTNTKVRVLAFLFVPPPLFHQRVANHAIQCICGLQFAPPALRIGAGAGRERAGLCLRES
jgi:hypothetical protein